MLSRDHFQHFIKSSLPIFEMTSKRRINEFIKIIQSQISFSIKSMMNIHYFSFHQDP